MPFANGKSWDIPYKIDNLSVLGIKVSLEKTSLDPNLTGSILLTEPKRWGPPRQGAHQKFRSIN